MGGSIGAMYAGCTSIGYIMLQTASILAASAWNNALQATLKYAVDEFPGWTVIVVMITAFLIAVSVVPGFAGGTLIAWVLSSAHGAEQMTMGRCLRMGAFVGAAFGMIIVGITLVTEFVIPGRSQFGLASALRNLVTAIEIVALAAVAGLCAARSILIRLLH